MNPDLEAWLRPRSKIVGGAAIGGAVTGVLAIVTLLLVLRDAAQVTELVFSMAALIFGFATLGWSGSIMAGAGFENLQQHLSTGSRWTERDSRRAMSRIGGFGAGGMVSATAFSILMV